MQPLLFRIGQYGHWMVDRVLAFACGADSKCRRSYLAMAGKFRNRLDASESESSVACRGGVPAPRCADAQTVIPDWVVAEMKNLGRDIDPALYPSPTFLRDCLHYQFPIRPEAGRVYEEALRQCTSGHYTHAFAIPWLKRGGADLVTLYHISAIASRGGARILVVMTEPGESPWRSRVPEGVDVIDLAGPLSGLPYADGLLVLARLMVQLQVDVLHIINSRHTWDVVGRYGLAIRQRSRIFGSIYCDDYDQFGMPTGFARDYLQASYKHLTKLFSDNTAFPRLLRETYGYAPDLFQVLHSPAGVEITYPTRREPRGRRVLWGGRLDRQKRPDILLAVAMAMPDVEFVLYGEILMDSDERVVRQLARLRNVRMMGPFDGVEALPFREFPIFLYTSQWDGTPTIVIAAALASIPIVASCVGGVGDIVSTETGFPVYDVEDVPEYVRCIEEALADPARAESRSLRARQLVQAEYTVERFEEALAACSGYMDGISDPREFAVQP